MNGLIGASKQCRELMQDVYSFNASNSEMNTAAGSFFPLITFYEHKSILPH